MVKKKYRKKKRKVLPEELSGRVASTSRFSSVRMLTITIDGKGG